MKRIKKRKPLIALVVASVIVVALAYGVQLAIRPAPPFRGYTHSFRMLKGINPLNADEGFKCPPSVLGWKLAELNGKEEVDSLEVALYMLSS